jgi:Spy/CpxP family protein refolding chaperone
MKTAWMTLLVAGLVGVAAYAWAGSACCASGKGKAKEAGLSACAEITATLNLSEEQKTKIADIEAACKAEGSTPEACAKSRDDIRALLTDDQKAQFDAAWEKKSGKKGASCG